MTIYRSKIYHSFPPWTANASSSLFCRNVLQDEAGRLKVTDFGLSKIAQQNDVSGYKMTGRTGSCKMNFSLKIKYFPNNVVLNFSDIAVIIFSRSVYGT